MQHQGTFTGDTSFNGFLKNEDIISDILKENISLSTIPKKIQKQSKNLKRIMFLAPFASNTKFQIKSDVEILGEKIAINILLEEDKFALAVLNQKFWIGQFTKNCQISTN
jgi:hypothetical protein